MTIKSTEGTRAARVAMDTRILHHIIISSRLPPTRGKQSNRLASITATKPTSHSFSHINNDHHVTERR